MGRRLIVLESDTAPAQRRASWKAKPSWYLVATADRAIQPSLERAMGKNIKAKTVEVAASYVAMLARPQETANLILEATVMSSLFLKSHSA
jgi:hypothetical protein